jgi:hypothetical protein
MKKLVQASALALAATALFAAPAFADGDVYFNVNKDKDVTIKVDTTKTKKAEIDVKFDKELKSSAAGQGLVNSRIQDNRVAPDGGASDTDQNLELKATTDGSINNNKGVVQFNQDVGNVTNQSNTIAAGIELSSEKSFVNAEGYAEQITQSNHVVHREGQLAPRNAPPMASTITNSIWNNEGVVMANQNTGNMNTQTNVLTAAVGGSAVYALADAGLAQEISYNSVHEINTVKRDLIANSANSNKGVVMVNQSTGNMNQQATIVNLAVLSSSVGLGN